MTTRTQEIREWTGDYVEGKTEEILFDLNREENGQKVDQARDIAVEATKDLYVNIMSETSFLLSEDDIRDGPEANAVANEVASEVTVDKMSQKRGDSYRKTAQEWINDEFPDEVTVGVGDLPHIQQYDEHIDSMLEVAFDEGVDAAKDPEVFYDAIRQEHPTGDDYREFSRKKQQASMDVLQEQLGQLVGQMGVNPETADEILTEYRENLEDAFDYVSEDLRDRWVDEIYGEDN